jgi:hypothetical protein
MAFVHFHWVRGDRLQGGMPMVKKKCIPTSSSVFRSGIAADLSFEPLAKLEGSIAPVVLMIRISESIHREG